MNRSAPRLRKIAWTPLSRALAWPPSRSRSTCISAGSTARRCSGATRRCTRRLRRSCCENGDYLVPVYRGQHFLDKPILPIWVVAASYRLLGVSVFAERLPTAVAGLLTALLLGLWVRRRAGERAGVLGGPDPRLLVPVRLHRDDLRGRRLSDARHPGRRRSSSTGRAARRGPTRGGEPFRVPPWPWASASRA